MFYSALLDKWPCFAPLLSRSASWQWLTSPQPVFPSFYPWHPWHPFLFLFLWQSIISKTWWVDSVFPSFYLHPWHPFPSHPFLFLFSPGFLFPLWQSIISETWLVDSDFACFFYSQPWHPFPSDSFLCLAFLFSFWFGRLWRRFLIFFFMLSNMWNARWAVMQAMEYRNKWDIANFPQNIG